MAFDLSTFIQALAKRDRSRPNSVPGGVLMMKPINDSATCCALPLSGHSVAEKGDEFAPSHSTIVPLELPLFHLGQKRICWLFQTGGSRELAAI
jgi:hypothetical protein